MFTALSKIKTQSRIRHAKGPAQLEFTILPLHQFYPKPNLTFHNSKACLVSSDFSIDKIPKVTSPVLVIHGTEDEVIDFSHGLAIYEKCPRPVEPLWVEVSENLNLLIVMIK